MKFLQGIPVAGAAGRIYNVIYLRKIQRYAGMKYRKRFLYDQARNMAKQEHKNGGEQGAVGDGAPDCGAGSSAKRRMRFQTGRRRIRLMFAMNNLLHVWMCVIMIKALNRNDIGLQRHIQQRAAAWY